MALVFTKRGSRLTGTRHRVWGTLAFDASYPTGGEAYTPSTFGLDSLDDIEVASVNVAGSRLVAVDKDNAKVLLFTALSTEAVNASDQSTIDDVECVVIGAGPG